MCIYLFMFSFLGWGWGGGGGGMGEERRVARGAILKNNEKRQTSLTESTHKDIIRICASSYFLIYHCMHILNCFKHTTFIVSRILIHVSKIVFNKCNKLAYQLSIVPKQFTIPSWIFLKPCYITLTIARATDKF